MTNGTKPEFARTNPSQSGVEDANEAHGKDIGSEHVAAEETSKVNDAKTAPSPVSKQNVTIGNVHQDASVQVVERQENSYLAQQIETVLISDQVAVARSFSMMMAESIDCDFDAELSSLAVYDEAFVAERLPILKQRRMAVITGPSDYGKGTFALVIAQRLRDADNSLSHVTQIVEPLDPQIRLNLRQLSKESDQIANRIVVFRDAFLGGNRDVKDFFAQLNMNVVRSMATQLEANNAYLLFTSDEDKVPRECSLAPDIIVTVPPLTESVMKEGLERRLERFAKAHESANKEFAEKVRRLDRDLIVTLGRTMTRISQFVEWYIVDVVHGSLSLEQAFERLDTLAVWFQNDLTKDPATWSFACSLVLLQPLGIGSGVPWYEFYEFHEVIRGHVLRWIDAKYPSQHGQLEGGRPINDQEVLERTRSQIVRDPSSQIDVIAFRNRNAAAKLWESLLISNRTLLCSLMPVLEGIANDGKWGSLRGRAAQALGRIGEIDPWRITRRLIFSWAKATEFSERVLAGYFFQGVRASRSKSYRKAGAEMLQMLGDNGDTLWTAIAAYKQIGTSDLPYAVDCLRQLAEKHMAERFENAQTIERRQLAQLDRNLGSAHLSEIGDVLQLLKVLSIFFQEAFKEDRGDALALQYALVSLCITCGPVPVFGELRKWMGGRAGLKALVAIMFLQEKGIASEILRRNEFIDIVDSGGVPRTVGCNPIVVAISSSTGAMRTVAGFLEDVFAGYYLFFPPHTTKYLDQMFFHHIKILAEGAISAPACRVAVEDLLIRLLGSMNLALHEQMRFVLKSDVEFASGKLRSIAESVLRRSVQV